jgi:hypothetical protein
MLYPLHRGARTHACRVGTHADAWQLATLSKTGNQQGAYYLAGFAVECALKACIAKKTRRHEFPADTEYTRKVYSHNLEQLLKLAHLDVQLETDMEARPQLADNWAFVRDWRVESRYQTSKLGGKQMTLAVNSPDGMLQWIKLHW